MPKVVINDKGLVIEPGDGPFESQVGQKITSTVLTADKTITAAGVYHLSKSGAGALTGTMPKVSNVPGGFFSFVSIGGLSRHILTCSAENVGQGAKFTFPSGTTGASNTPQNGSRLVLDLPASSSVLLFCNGAQYQILASSGTVTLDQA